MLQIPYSLYFCLLTLRWASRRLVHSETSCIFRSVYIGPGMLLYRPHLPRHCTVSTHFLLRIANIPGCPHPGIVRCLTSKNVLFLTSNTQCQETCPETVLLTHGSPTASLVVRTCSISHGFDAYPKRFKHSPSKSLERILPPIASPIRFKSAAFLFLSRKIHRHARQDK